MLPDIPGEAAAQAMVNTIEILTVLYLAGRPIFLTIGGILILAALFMTIRHKPPQYSSREIGPYNPKFDPLQKKQQQEANKWRFLAMIIFIFGLAPWILELMIFAGVV